MTRKNSNLVGGGISYETPSAKTLELMVEGVLCGSITTTKYTLPDATEDNWGTL